MAEKKCSKMGTGMAWNVIFSESKLGQISLRSQLDERATTNDGNSNDWNNIDDGGSGNGVSNDGGTRKHIVSTVCVIHNYPSV